MITTEDYLRSLINDRNKIINKIEAHGDSVPSNPTFGELANIYNNTSLLPYDYSPRGLFSPNIATIYTVEPQVYLYTKFTNNLSGFYSGLYGGNVQNMDASNATAGVNAFFSVSSLNLNGANFNNMINIDGMFANTSGNAFINNIKFGNVITASNLFSNSNISTIDVNLSNLQNAASMFENCVNLTSVAGNIGDSGSLTNMYHMYSGCGNLQNIPNVVIRDNISNIEGILRINDSTMLKVPAQFNLDIQDNNHALNFFRGVFTYSNVINVSNLIISNETQSSSNIFGILQNCKMLQSVYNVNLPKTTTGIGGGYTNLFYDCANLTTVSNLNVTGCKDISGMFRNCKKINNVSVIGNFSQVTNASNAFSYSSSGAIVTNDTADFSNVVNASYMFNNGGIRNGVVLKFNKVIDASYMFAENSSGFSGRVDVDMGYSPIENASHMFYNHSYTYRMNITNLRFDTIKDATYMFNAVGSGTIKNITGNGYCNFANATSLSQAFSYCFENDLILDLGVDGVSMYSIFWRSNIVNLTIINQQKANLCWAFQECYFPYINLDIDLRGENLRSQFRRCTNLISLPNFYNYNGLDCSYFCDSCYNLVDVPIIEFAPNSSVLYAFRSCNNLSNDSIINIATSLVNAGTMPYMNFNSTNFQSLFYQTNINVLNCGVPEEVLSALNANGWTY